MVLNEEHGEHNQQKWLSRIARERQGLSISIEKTLEETPSSDELNWVDEEHGDTNMHRATHDTSLIPPRLSLQSRVLTAVEPRGDHMATANSPEDVASNGVAEEGIPNTTRQNTNVLMRFAQRLTSSFNALNVVPDAGPEGTAGTERDEKSSKAQPVKVGRKASSLAAIADVEVCTASTTEELPMKEASSEVSSYPGRDSKEESHPSQSRQRLAGRTTRVRLEVVPGAHSTRSKTHTKKVVNDKMVPASLTDQKVQRTDTESGAPFPVEQEWFEESGMTSASMPVIRSTSQRKKEMTGTHLSAIPATQQEKGTTDADLPAARFPHSLQEEKKTGVHLPIAHSSYTESGLTWDVPHLPDSVDVADSLYNGSVGSRIQGSLSGSGVFESGQSEATVANAYVTMTSVILVTLTSNPGPVVVQYITLQPQTGFTVHLTAPTVIRTTFNYIVLLGELF